MLTDAPPRNSNLAGFQESDRFTRLDLPVDANLPEIAKSIESAMKSEQTARIRSTRDMSSARTCPSEQAREEAASSYAAALPGAVAPLVHGLGAPEDENAPLVPKHLRHGVPTGPPVTRIDRMVLYSVKELERFMEERTEGKPKRAQVSSALILRQPE